jgi:hypothetical protein
MDRTSDDTNGRVTPAVVGLSYDAKALIADVHALGIPLEANGRRDVVGGQLRPSATKLIGQFLERDMPESCRSVYPLLSANAHGTLWAITLHFTANPPDAVQHAVATYRVTQGWLDGPANVALLGFSWTLEPISPLLGWPAEPVLALMRPETTAEVAQSRLEWEQLFAGLLRCSPLDAAELRFRVQARELVHEHLDRLSELLGEYGLHLSRVLGDPNLPVAHNRRQVTAFVNAGPEHPAGRGPEDRAVPKQERFMEGESSPRHRRDDDRRSLLRRRGAGQGDLLPHGSLQGG